MGSRQNEEGFICILFQIEDFEEIIMDTVLFAIIVCRTNNSYNC